MTRRELAGLLVASAVTPAAARAAARPGPTASLVGPEVKQWARAHYRGCENAILPSFTPDFRSLDEDGIRRDVEASIRHGFFASSCTDIGLTLDESKRFSAVVADAAAGRILCGTILQRTTFEENLELLRAAEQAGHAHAFVVYPRGEKPTSEDDVYAWLARLAEATSLGLVLYGTPQPNTARFHPSGMPLAAFRRAADLPNVVAMKLTQTIGMAAASELCDVFSDRLVMNCTNLDHLPVLSRAYGVSMTGQWNVEAVQSPAKPYAVEMLAAFNAGRRDDAMGLYWALAPAYRAIADLQAPLLRNGGHPWAHIKYDQWLVGGNGGLIRPPAGDYVPTLDKAGRDGIANAYRSIAITPREGPEDAFIVGDAAFERGVRPDRAAPLPSYA